MAGNRDILKQGYEDFNNGDVQAATANWPDDFVWDGGEADELPGSGIHEGKGAALEVLGKAVGSWDEFTLHIDEIVGDGDMIVALGHTHVAKGGKSGNLPVVHVWHFAGDTPKRLSILTDSLQSARLLGVI